MAKSKAGTAEASAAGAVDTRGQIAIELEGQKFMLRPSYEAINSIEMQTGQSLYDLAGEATAGRMKAESIGLIVAELMRAHGKANPQDPLASTYIGAKPQRIAELVYEEGVPYVIPAIVAVLIGALTGGYTASGEVKTPGT